MNIKLFHNKSSFNVDVLKDTPCQYLFEVAQKVFRIPIDDIILKYQDIEIQNNSRLVFSVMGKTDPDNITGDEMIMVSKRSKLSKSINNSCSNIRDSVKLPLINSSILHNEQSIHMGRTSKSRKKGGGSAITCQICNLKNSIFYCRVCNLFVCFECNVRFNEHKKHERINLEDGDSFLGCDVYREELINEINIIELGFQKTLQWMIDNEERENFLQQLFKLLEQIRNNSLSLADMKTLYNLNQDIIDDFRIEIDKIPKPRHKEEIFEIYGNLNLKENELRNYIKFLNLQIIKTEYNKVLLKCLDKVKQNLDIVSKELKSKLVECEDVKFRGLEDVNIYIKESKLKKNQMDIGNYLSKNYVGNKYNNSLNNNNFILNKINNSDNNNESSSHKTSTNDLNIFIDNNSNTNNNTINNTKNTFIKNNNSLFDKRVNLTVDKKNKPIKIIENQKKAITLNLDSNNIKSENKDRYSGFKLDLSPLKSTKKSIFKIKNNNDESKTKIKKINILSNKLKQGESNDQQFINAVKNKKDIRRENIIVNNRKEFGLTNNLKDKKSNQKENDENLNKPSDEDDIILKNKLNTSNSIYQTLTSSEKKIVFGPPIIVKNNSYGKNIMNRKNNILSEIS